MQDDILLTQYRRDGSQAAFSQLVARHLALVYSTCLRETGSPTQAEDAAQVVFLLLARKAKSLQARSSLAGWLYQTARFVAKDVRKQEARRQQREQIVMQEMAHRQETPKPEWEHIEPLLNDALSALKPKEREAVLLRFLEGHTLAETGAVLGLTEDAARMRVTRAVEKLRRYLTAHGTTVTGTVFAALLASEAARPVPTHAADAIMRGTMTAFTTGPTPNVLLLSKGVSHTMTLIKVKYAALAVGLLLAGASVPPLVHAFGPPKTSVKVLAVPVPLAENVTTRTTLDTNQHTFYSVTLPKGASMIILDTRRTGNNAGNMEVSLSLNDKVQSQSQGNTKPLGQIEMKSTVSTVGSRRVVTWCSLRKPKTLTFDLHNQGVQCQYWLTVFPISSAVVVSGFEVSPSLAIPRFGETLPKPMALGETKAGRLEGNGTAYFTISLKAGHYQSRLGFSSVSGKPTDLNGELLLDDEKGASVFNEEGLPETYGTYKQINELHGLNVSMQDVSKFALKKDGMFLVTISNQADQSGNVEPVNFTEQIMPDDSSVPPTQQN